jgi:hypothetical protein
VCTRVMKVRTTLLQKVTTRFQIKSKGRSNRGTRKEGWWAQKLYLGELVGGAASDLGNADQGKQKMKGEDLEERM